MEPSLALILFVAGYLVGAISFTRIVTRMVDPQASLDDVYFPIEGTDEKLKMHAMGANTASMKYGSRVGCTIGALDMLKVFLPTLIVRMLFSESYYPLVVAMGGMIGHNWPVFNRFKGGRGISAFYGGLLAIDPIGAILTSALGMLVGMMVFKDFLIAYLAGLWLIIPWLWFTTQDVTYLIYGLVANFLFIVAMLPELRDILKVRDKFGKGSLPGMMDKTPMGRSMLKIMEKLRFRKS